MSVSERAASRLLRSSPQPQVTRAASGASEAVAVQFGGRVWNLTRGQLCRVPGSVPHALFREGSAFLGTSIHRAGGCWVWRPADAAAAPEEVHAVVCFLQQPRRLAAPEEGVRQLAVRWKLDKAMF